MPPPTITELLERNTKHANNFSPLPKFPEFAEHGLEIPNTVNCCADPRIIPEDIFQLKIGDSIVMRTIAGHPQNVLNDILALDTFAGVNDLVVVHHTDCGATYFTEESVSSELKRRSPNDVGINSMKFGAIDDLHQSLKDDVEFLKASPYIRKELGERTRGFMYDIKTGKVEEMKL